MTGDPLTLAHLLVVLMVVLALAHLGRLAATALRQPTVVGEIAVGLVAGPALLAWAGAPVRSVLLPEPVLDLLRSFGEIGLVLYLVGVAHELRPDSAGVRGRTIAWVTAGSAVPPAAAGAAFAGWVLLTGGPELRGDAPVGALVLLLVVAMAVTAVPVLARILADRGMATSRTGRLAMTSAVLIDVVAWLALAAAVAVASGTSGGVLASVLTLAGGVLAALLIRFLLGASPAMDWCAAHPRVMTAVLVVVALAVAGAAEAGGMTAIFGAFVTGLAVPRTPGSPWAEPVRRVATVGKALVPVFFVVTGLTLLTPATEVPWAAIVLATVLAAASKIFGGHAGARLAGESHRTGLRLGVLMNTRGLTEIVVLQVGHDAGILTAPLYLALVVMAVLTTVATGPLLALTTDLQLRFRGGAIREPTTTDRS